MKKFHLKNFLDKPSDTFHIARTTIDSSEDLNLHSHDYYEFFYISNGRGVHLLNGEEEKLETGSFCFIRDHDTHTFKKVSKEGLVITNIAIPKDIIHQYSARYFDGKPVYWTTNDIPFKGTFNKEALKELINRVNILLDNPRISLYLDLFMLHLFDILQQKNTINDEIPNWLIQAIEKFRMPHQLNKGQAAFLDLCQRSADHVNRVVKKSYGMTLSELINKERVHYCAKQLSMTNASLKNIYTAAGYQNHSYFFRVFKREFGVTPLKYRGNQHKIF
ncbi:helix-turn-helix domain-containing protein [Flammeovirga sp. MY04]|uniref:helix-turn-helix domain-containing protein n=1 Tax=Flammeovirga sp. MY04 TaxID=1191459 RepID=UPI0008062EA7|nr:helix-turn-helix domain-containing protein [Flammeovirga sp. MY04]ANQ50454.1 helix-turn-helix domain-containing protein [Flammeovirga sp. MY04]